MPAAVAIPLALAGGTAAAGIGGAMLQSGAAKDAAKLSTDAANHAADVQGKSTADALAFQKQQAENEWLNSQNTQRANYDQSKARYGSIAGVASQYGLNLAGMPDYAAGIDPHYDTGQTPTPGSGSIAGAGPSASPTGGQAGAAEMKALLDSGVDPQQAVSQFNQKYGRTTGNQAVYYDPSQHGGVATIGLPDAYLAKPGASWDITQRSGAGSIAGASKPLPSAAVPPSYTAPAVTTGIPTPYQPGSIAAMGRRY